jgi:hypothetical protein
MTTDNYRSQLARLIRGAFQTKPEIEKWVMYCSACTEIEGYAVSVVIQFDRKAINALPSLTKSGSGTLQVKRSLLEATVTVFLDFLAGGCKNRTRAENC